MAPHVAGGVPGGGAARRRATTSSTRSPTSRSSSCGRPTTRSGPTTTRAATGAPGWRTAAGRSPTARSPARSTAGAGTSTARARSCSTPRSSASRRSTRPRLRLGELRVRAALGLRVGVRRPRRPPARRAPRARCRTTSIRCTSRACGSSGTARRCCPRTGRPRSTRSTRGTTTTGRTRSCCSGPTTPPCATSSSPTATRAYVTVRGAGPSKRFGMSPDEWDDRELLYQQVMHLGRSFEGGLYSDDDMEAAGALRTMEIPEGSTAAAEFARSWPAARRRAGHRVPRADARAAGRGHRRVLGVPEPRDAGEPGQLLHVPGPAERRRPRLVHLRHVGAAPLPAVGSARPRSCARPRRTTSPRCGA